MGRSAAEGKVLSRGDHTHIITGVGMGCVCSRNRKGGAGGAGEGESGGET